MNLFAPWVTGDRNYVDVPHTSEDLACLPPSVSYAALPPAAHAGQEGLSTIILQPTLNKVQPMYRGRVHRLGGGLCRFAVVAHMKEGANAYRVARCRQAPQRNSRRCVPEKCVGEESVQGTGYPSSMRGRVMRTLVRQ